MADGDGNAPQPNGLWRVVDRQVGTAVTAGGSFYDEVTVFCETTTGFRFPIKLPLAQFTNAALVALANAYAQEFETTGQLGN